jgi:hypothetical protein
LNKTNKYVEKEILWFKIKYIILFNVIVSLYLSQQT